MRTESLARPLALFAALGLLALALVAASGVIVIRRLASEQALAEARQLTVLSARVVERRLQDGFLTGDADAAAAVARVVFDAVLREPVVRVKIWTREGEIVYSDESRLIGARYSLGAEDLDVLEEGGVASEVSDLAAPENRFEASFGELIEVYTQMEMPDGTPLLFETYQRASSISERRAELATTFAPVLVTTLVALALLEIPLAWVLARRVRAAQRERERLMQRAIEASDRERRRVAGDLHDGPVQELAGLSMRLSAAAERVDDADAAEALRGSASGVRASVRTLRSAILGIYPANLRVVGLRSALSDLVAGTVQRGLATELHLDGETEFDEEVDALLYRVAQEALRNAEEHASASSTSVAVRREAGLAVLSVTDDGAGIDPATLERARGEGHIGLAILADLASDAGGRLIVEPSPSGGTIVRVEVPIR
jgi:signal transduction histidine kinase